MKIALVAFFVFLVFLIIGFGAFYLGKKSSEAPVQSTKEEQKEMQKPQEETQPKEDVEFFKKTISAGGAVSFASYTILVPKDWKETKEHDEKTDIDRLTLTKDLYEIRIFQGATGGALCLYPGDPDSEGPSARYDNFTEIKTSQGDILRRSGTEGSQEGFTICEKKDQDYIQPTSFGHINYKLPKSLDSKVLFEMDEIISTLKRK